MRALLLATLAACTASDQQLSPAAQLQGPADEPVGTPLSEASSHPAPGPYPNPPSIDRPENEPLPERVALERDAASVGRMNGEGLTARFDFEARAGELSLFELTAWGYARGWTSDSVMVVRSAAGEELARSERTGGTVYQDVLPFVAAADGAFTLELGTGETGFRYRVIRHSGFVPHAQGAILATGKRSDVHEWLAGADDSVTFRVTGKPGERVILRAEPTDERGMKHKRSLRRRIAPGLAGFASVERVKERLGPRGRDDDSFPDLVVTVDESVLFAGRGHAAIARVPASGWFDATVTRSNGGPPGLFDLAIERGPVFTSFAIRVGDRDDDPVAGAEVALFREPAFDLVGLVTAGDEGVAEVDVPIGDYTLVFRGPGESPSTLRTRVTGEPLNVVVETR